MECASLSYTHIVPSLLMFEPTPDERKLDDKYWPKALQQSDTTDRKSGSVGNQSWWSTTNWFRSSSTQSAPPQPSQSIHRPATASPALVEVPQVLTKEVQLQHADRLARGISHVEVGGATCFSRFKIIPKAKATPQPLPYEQATVVLPPAADAYVGVIPLVPSPPSRVDHAGAAPAHAIGVTTHKSGAGVLHPRSEAVAIAVTGVQASPPAPSSSSLAPAQAPAPSSLWASLGARPVPPAVTVTTAVANPAPTSVKPASTTCTSARAPAPSLWASLATTNINTSINAASSAVNSSTHAPRSPTTAQAIAAGAASHVTATDGGSVHGFPLSPCQRFSATPGPSPPLTATSLSSMHGGQSAAALAPASVRVLSSAAEVEDALAAAMLHAEERVRRAARAGASKTGTACHTGQHAAPTPVSTSTSTSSTVFPSASADSPSAALESMSVPLPLLLSDPVLLARLVALHSVRARAVRSVARQHRVAMQRAAVVTGYRGGYCGRRGKAMVDVDRVECEGGACATGDDRYGVVGMTGGVNGRVAMAPIPAPTSASTALSSFFKMPLPTTCSWLPPHTQRALRRSLLAPLKCPALYHAVGASPHAAVILTSHTRGAGKKTILDSLIREYGFYVQRVSLPSLLTVPANPHTPHPLQQAVHSCCSNGPAVLVVDGIDELLPLLGAYTRTRVMGNLEDVEGREHGHAGGGSAGGNGHDEDSAAASSSCSPSSASTSTESAAAVRLMSLLYSEIDYIKSTVAARYRQARHMHGEWAHLLLEREGAVWNGRRGEEDVGAAIATTIAATTPAATAIAPTPAQAQACAPVHDAGVACQGATPPMQVASQVQGVSVRDAALAPCSLLASWARSGAQTHAQMQASTPTPATTPSPPPVATPTTSSLPTSSPSPHSSSCTTSSTSTYQCSIDAAPTPTLHPDVARAKAMMGPSLTDQIRKMRNSGNSSQANTLGKMASVGGGAPSTAPVRIIGGKIVRSNFPGQTALSYHPFTNTPLHSTTIVPAPAVIPASATQYTESTMMTRMPVSSPPPPPPPVVVVVLTNQAHNLPAALTTPNRCSDTVWVPLPDVHGRMQLLREISHELTLHPSLLFGSDDDKEQQLPPAAWAAVAENTKGCSPAFLRAVCERAAGLAVRRMLEAEEEGDDDDEEEMVERACECAGEGCVRCGVVWARGYVEAVNVDEDPEAGKAAKMEGVGGQEERMSDDVDVNNVDTHDDNLDNSTDECDHSVDNSDELHPFVEALRATAQVGRLKRRKTQTLTQLSSSSLFKADSTSTSTSACNDAAQRPRKLRRVCVAFPLRPPSHSTHHSHHMHAGASASRHMVLRSGASVGTSVGVSMDELRLVAEACIGGVERDAVRARERARGPVPRLAKSSFGMGSRSRGHSGGDQGQGGDMAAASPLSCAPLPCIIPRDLLSSLRALLREFRVKGYVEDMSRLRGGVRDGVRGEGRDGITVAGGVPQTADDSNEDNSKDSVVMDNTATATVAGDGINPGDAVDAVVMLDTLVEPSAGILTRTHLHSPSSSLSSYSSSTSTSSSSSSSSSTSSSSSLALRASSVDVCSTLMQLAARLNNRGRRAHNTPYAEPSAGGGDASAEAGALAEEEDVLPSLVGLHALKKHIYHHLIVPLRYPHLYARYSLSPSSGLLLYGPPGCGKTLVARLLAQSERMSFLSASASELLSPYIGQSEENVRALVQRARRQAPCVLFLDEVDAIMSARSNGPGPTGGGANTSDRVVCQLLACLDEPLIGAGHGDAGPAKLTVRGEAQASARGNERDSGSGAARSGREEKTTSSSSSSRLPRSSRGAPQVFLIAATNRPWALDPALLRGGRLGHSVYVGMPDAAARADMLRRGLGVGAAARQSAVVYGSKGVDRNVGKGVSVDTYADGCIACASTFASSDAPTVAHTPPSLHMCTRTPVSMVSAEVTGVALAELAVRMRGYTGADVQSLIDNAKQLALARTIAALSSRRAPGHEALVTLHDLQHAFAHSRASVKVEDVLRFMQYKYCDALEEGEADQGEEEVEVKIEVEAKGADVAGATLLSDSAASSTCSPSDPSIYSLLPALPAALPLHCLAALERMEDAVELSLLSAHGLFGGEVKEEEEADGGANGPGAIEARKRRKVPASPDSQTQDQAMSPSPPLPSSSSDSAYSPRSLTLPDNSGVHVSQHVKALLRAVWPPQQAQVRALIARMSDKYASGASGAPRRSAAPQEDMDSFSPGTGTATDAGAEDFVVKRAKYGSASVNTGTDADANTDGLMRVEDYLPNSSSSAGTAVSASTSTSTSTSASAMATSASAL